MDKMNYPRGLIRYATQNGMDQGWTQAQMLRRALRPRVLVYGAVMVAISVGFVASLALRQPFKVDVVRDRGTLARQVEDGRVENVYRLQVMNATEAVQRYRVRVTGIEQATIASTREVEVGPTEARWFAVRVQLPPGRAAALGPGAHPLAFEIGRLGDEGKAEVHEKSTFMVPR
jgi:polyferredoxin